MNNGQDSAREVLTGTKVVKVVTMVGMCCGGFLFGWGLYHHDSTQMIIFGALTLACGASFASAVAKANK